MRQQRATLEDRLAQLSDDFSAVQGKGNSLAILCRQVCGGLARLEMLFVARLALRHANPSCYNFCRQVCGCPAWKIGVGAAAGDLTPVRTIPHRQLEQGRDEAVEGQNKLRTDLRMLKESFSATFRQDVAISQATAAVASDGDPATANAKIEKGQSDAKVRLMKTLTLTL